MTVVRRAFPAEPASAGEARRFVDALLTAAGRPALSFRATLLVSELVANAVLHTGTPLEVVVAVERDCVRVEVHDGNRQLPVRRHYSALSATGRGILLVDRMASAWGAEPTAAGKLVWFSLDGDNLPSLDVLGAEAI